MKITIAERLKPFSHTPGTKTVLPGSGQLLQVFPTLIRFEDFDIPLPLTGPAKDFTVQLDLEKGNIKIWGHYVEGYKRYTLTAAENGAVALTLKDETTFYNGNPGNLYTPPKTDRLSLGNHKAQDWDLVNRRSDLAEILPFWLRLGQLIPQHKLEGTGGTLTLLNNFPHLFQAGLEGMLSPRLTDTEHQGFNLPEVTDGNPLLLLTEGAKNIRDHFVKITEDTIEILPTHFHAGRFLNINSNLDIEWTKNNIRRINYRTTDAETRTFKFPKKIKSYRLNKQKKALNGDTLHLEPNTTYHFDNFQK